MQFEGANKNGGGLFFKIRVIYFMPSPVSVHWNIESVASFVGCLKENCQ
jgi:hypothetical protein